MNTHQLRYTEALEAALGRIVARATRELETIKAQADAVVAGANARVTECELRLERSAAERLASVRDGEPGRQGERGEKGDRGEPGESITGPQGEPGEAGPAGRDGIDGKDGPAGEPGPAGERGPQGEPGEPGVSGERGTAGERGAQGERGEAGPAGDPSSLILPDTISAQVTRALETLAQSIPLQTASVPSPTVIVNIADRERPTRTIKTIRPRREDDGSFVADVIEDSQ